MKSSTPLLVLALGVLAIGFLSRQRADQEAPEPSDGIRPVPSPTPAPHLAGRAEPSPRLEAGRFLAWRHESVQSIAFDGVEDTLEVNLTGRLEARVYEVRPSGRLLGFTLEDVRVAVTGPGAEGNRADDATAASLAREILVDVDEKGRVRGIGFDADVGPAARNLWRDVLARWQSAVLDAAARETVDAEEQDTTGTYLAHYERIAAGEGAWRKTKGPHRSVGGEPTGPASWATAVRGGAVLRVGGGGDLLSIAWDEEGDARMASEAPALHWAFRSETTLLEARADAGIRALAAERSAEFERRSRSSLAGEGVPRDAVRPRPVGPLAAARALDLLERLAVEAESGAEEHAEPFAALVGAVENDPSAAGAVAARLAREPMTPALAAALSGALSSAGTAEAQEALARIAADDDAAREGRRHAVAALGFLEHPSGEVDAVLDRLLDSDPAVASVAARSLGSVAGRVRETDPARAERLLERLAVEVERVPGEQRRVNPVLAAMGDAGFSAPPRVLRERLSSADEGIRMQALASLAASSDAESRSLLLAAAREDASAAVRLFALERIVETRHPSLDDAIRAASLDRSEAVRRYAAEASAPH